jgi:hypothetical protein
MPFTRQTEGAASTATNRCRSFPWSFPPRTLFATMALPHRDLLPQFAAVDNPTPATFTELEALFPENPFYTREYAQAIAETGAIPSIFTVRLGPTLQTGCTAFAREGRLSRVLEIPSLPTLDRVPECFWSGLRQHLLRTRTTNLAVDTFGSTTAAIPMLGKQIARQERVEFLLDIQHRNLWEAMNAKHRQSITRARRAGVIVRRATEPTAIEQHVGLMTQSLLRHKSQGEDVDLNGDTTAIRALVKHGAASVFQAVYDDRVLASATILRAARGAYYHTAGNHPDGLALGASHFMLYEIATALAAEGVTLFNLGGTSPANEGLVRFKTRFGARVVPLEAASFYVGGSLRGHLIAAWRALRGLLR